jgi:hypothetical protein
LARTKTVEFIHTALNHHTEDCGEAEIPRFRKEGNGRFADQEEDQVELELAKPQASAFITSWRIRQELICQRWSIFLRLYGCIKMSHQKYKFSLARGSRLRMAFSTVECSTLVFIIINGGGLQRGSAAGADSQRLQSTFTEAG